MVVVPVRLFRCGRFRIVIEDLCMQIWVDADACPGAVKELLFRAASRTETKVTLVANQPMRTPRSEFIDSLLVAAGMNVADRRIAELAGPHDLVAIIRTPSNEEMADLITGSMLRMVGIEKTTTLVALKTYSRYDLDRIFSLGMEGGG